MKSVITGIIICLNIVLAQSNLIENEKQVLGFGLGKTEIDRESLMKLTAGYKFNNWVTGKLSGIIDLEKKMYDEAFGFESDFMIHYPGYFLTTNLQPEIKVVFGYIRAKNNSVPKSTTDQFHLNTYLGLLYKIKINDRIIFAPKIMFQTLGLWKREEIDIITDTTFGNIKTQPYFTMGLGIGLDGLIKITDKNHIGLFVNYFNEKNFDAGINYLIVID